MNNLSDFSLGTRSHLWVLSLTNKLQDHEIVSFNLWGSLSYSAPISPVAWALTWSLLAEAVLVVLQLPFAAWLLTRGTACCAGGPGAPVAREEGESGG